MANQTMTEMVREIAALGSALGCLLREAGYAGRTDDAAADVTLLVLGLLPADEGRRDEALRRAARRMADGGTAGEAAQDAVGE